MTLDEFKARIPLIDVVARRVRLMRRGRTLVGLCPFHNEKTPSFTVSEDKGFFHCFGCGKHGNAIDFVMASEGLEFRDALERISELTGIPAPVQRMEDSTVRDLRTVNEAAARWFRSRLEGIGGDRARVYLERRRMRPEVSERFRLGFAPDDRTALLRALQSEGYGVDQVVEAGLAIRPEDGGAPFDRFRDRLMFPIQDARGRVVGFGGRALGEARAKYLNSPETPLFHKGELLYGHALARAAARQGSPVILTEGYMDVIALAQAGFGAAVAPLGTSVTESQLGALWQLGDVPLICLDGDRAGMEAAHRLLDRALPLLRPGKSLRFALLPPGEDPDSLLRADGPDAIRQVLDGAIHLVDFLFRREISGADLASPERRAALDRRFRDLGRTIPDRDTSRHVVGALFERLRQHRASRRPWSGPSRPSRDPEPAGVGTNRLAQSLAKRARAPESALLGPVLARPELLSLIEEDLAALEFAEPDLNSLKDEILGWYCAAHDLEAESLRNHLARVDQGQLADSLRIDEVAPAVANALPTLDVEAGRWRALRDCYRLNDRDQARARFAEAIARGEAEFSVHLTDADALLNARLRETAQTGERGEATTSLNDPESSAPAASTVIGRGT